MPQAAWMTATWFRILAGIAAVIVAGYALLVPAALLFLSIGSLECLGPPCDFAVPVSLVGGAAGVLAGVATAVVLVILAVRPSKALLIAGLIGLTVLPIALLAQVWGLRALDEGRHLAAEAQQLSFELDRAMQEVLVEVSGASSLQQPGILGPEEGANACDLPGGELGYEAWSQLTFTGGVQVSLEEQQAIRDRFDQTRERMIMLPADISLTQEWQPDGEDIRWKVTASCQPLPTVEATSAQLPQNAEIEFRFTDASVPPEYHRSYTLITTRDETSISIDSYGDLLYEATVPTTSDVWESLSANYPSIAELSSPPEGSCTGDTSSSIEVTANGSTLLDVSASSCDEAAQVATRLNDWIVPARSLFAPMDELAPPSD